MSSPTIKVEVGVDTQCKQGGFTEMQESFRGIFCTPVHCDDE